MANGKTSNKNQVAKSGAFDFDIAERPDHVDAESRRGSENVQPEDLTIPRIDLIQSISPQRKKTDPAYIEGAEEGMLFNSVSSKLYGSSVIFIACFFRKEWIIWKDRKKGGGFRGAFASEELARTALATEVNPDERSDCEILDTAQHFGLIIDTAKSTAAEPVVEEVVFSMSKSKMKPSRRLNSLIALAGGDRFSRFYEIKGIEAKNANNEDYYNFDVKQMGYVPQPLFAMAEKVYEEVSKGIRDVSRSEGTAPADDLQDDGLGDKAQY